MATYRLNLKPEQGEAPASTVADALERSLASTLTRNISGCQVSRDPSTDFLLVSVPGSGLAAYASIANQVRAHQQEKGSGWNFQLLPEGVSADRGRAGAPDPYALERERLARQMLRYESGLFAEELLGIKTK